MVEVVVRDENQVCVVVDFLYFEGVDVDRLSLVTDADAVLGEDIDGVCHFIFLLGKWIRLLYHILPGTGMGTVLFRKNMLTADICRDMIYIERRHIK
jgi:hypothetical protein